MTTPHIAANPGDFAETLLMPGDPLRARFIAEHYLDDVRQVTAVRNMLGYTGHYRGQRVSVMGSGMGIPSISIYATELYQQFGVRRIVRVGSCGAIASHLKLGDLVVAMGASTDSSVNRQRCGGHDFAAIASYPLLRRVVAEAERQGLALHVGNCFSTDQFYHPDGELLARWQRLGVLAVEMEAAGLYGVAAACGGEALALLTVSDHCTVAQPAMSPAQREQGLGQMVQLALDALG